jgi:hypothetical protein
MNMTKSLLAAVALAAAAAAQGQVFNTISGPFSGTALPTGINGTMFYVSSPVTVNSLAFVDSGTAGLGGSADVGIYSYVGTPNTGNFGASALVSATITSASAPSANYAWENVAPTLLAPGFYGILVTSSSLSGDNFGDTTAGADGVPVFTGAPVASGAANSTFIADVVGGSLALPTHAGAHRFKLVNFGFTPVPEPETYAMIAGVGLVAFGLWRRRQ